MALWSSWFNDVLPEAPGALKPVVEHAIRRAAQEFFLRSKVWKTSVTLDLLAGEPVSSIDAGDSLAMVELLNASGVHLRLTDEDMQDLYGPEWRTATGPVTDLIVVLPGMLRAYPIPVADVSFELLMSVQPGDNATGIPDDLAMRYRDAIAAGALSRLMLSPKKPYSDDARGQLKRAEFEAGIGQAYSDRASAFGTARIRRKTRWC